MHKDDFICPFCGAEVPAKAAVCPGCGSDEKTGWSHETHHDGTGIEDPEEFDYNAWYRREMGIAPTRSGRQWVWWFVAVLALALFVVWMVLR